MSNTFSMFANEDMGKRILTRSMASFTFVLNLTHKGFLRLVIVIGKKKPKGGLVKDVGLGG